MKNTVFSLVAAATVVAASQANTLSLEPIVVSASKTTQTLKNTTSDVEIITADDIAEKHFTTVVDALNSLTGISYTANGGLGASQDVFIRGMAGNRILVLVDGIRYNDPSNTAGAHFSHLMIGDIERIEVIKGAQSGVWGADASAGVINIITKQAVEGTHGGVTLEAGSFNTLKRGGFVSHRTSLYDLKASINRITSDSFSVQAPYGSDVTSFEKDPYANTTVTLSGHVRPTSTDTIGLTHTNISALSNYDGWNAPNSTQRSDVNTKLSGITYDKVLNNHSLSAKINLSQFERNELDTAWGVKIFNGQTKEIELQDRLSYGEKDFMIVGLSKQWFDMDFIRADATTGSNTVDSKAFYATNTNIFGNLILTESLRRDDYSNFDAKTTGKIGAKYYLSDHYYAKANYGTAYTAPSQIQIFNPWGTSNPDLKPENSQSYDIGFGSANWSVSYFNNKVTNLISWVGSGYTNTEGQSIFEGFEASANRSIGSSIALRAGYTYLSKCENALGQELRRRPKEELKASLDYYGIENLHLGFNANYVGTRYDLDNQAGRQTGRYTLLGFIANYKVNDAVQVFAKVNNLTDKEYQVTDGYATSPRAWYAGLQASF